MVPTRQNLPYCGVKLSILAKTEAPVAIKGCRGFLSRRESQTMKLKLLIAGAARKAKA